jgi:16S rRNA (uracil1498-N3)-methyltransferase
VSERSARFPAGDHGAKRLAHWRQVVVAACEQCGRNRVPEVHHPMPLGDWLSPARTGIVLDADAGASLAAVAPASDLYALVGPEGGLTEREVAQASRAGLHPVRLGPRILRAETAALAALAAVNLTWGDFR